MYGRHGVNPLAFLLGLAIIFIGLLVFRAAIRNMGEGNCLMGCCLWEMADSILDLGCGLIGCGAALGLLILPIVAWGLHH